MDVLAFARYAVETGVKKAGSIVGLAQNIQVSQATIHNWQTGTIPRFDAAMRLVAYIGGEPERLHPDYDPAAEGNAELRREIQTLVRINRSLLQKIETAGQVLNVSAIDREELDQAAEHIDNDPAFRYNVAEGEENP